MKNILVMVTLVALGWFANSLYKQHDFSSIKNIFPYSEKKDIVKCITAKGRVIYGTVPPDIICKRTEQIKGSLTIVPSESLFSASSKATNKKQSPSKCDGRTYCSQMKSCAEATFFLKNCPNIKMDGNSNGIPCEKQWCK